MKTNSFVGFSFVLIYKIDKVINKFLLPRDKFTAEMHLRHPGFTYSAYGPFTKNKGRIKKFKETRDSRYIYQMNYNVGHNILRHFDILLNSSVATSEMKCDY